MSISTGSLFFLTRRTDFRRFREAVFGELDFSLILNSRLNECIIESTSAGARLGVWRLGVPRVIRTLSRFFTIEVQSFVKPFAKYRCSFKGVSQRSKSQFSPSRYFLEIIIGQQ